MRHRLLPLLLPLALISVLGGARPADAAEPREPSAADRVTARSLMDRGFDQKQAGDLSGAMESFRAAHEIMGVPTTGLELARVLTLMGRFVDARAACLDVTRSPERATERAPMKAARASAAALAEELEGKVSRLVVELRGFPAQATVTLDGAIVRPSSAEPEILVDPGKHVLRAEGGGHTASEVVDVRSGERRSVVLAAPAPAAPPPVAPPAAPSSPFRPPKSVPIALAAGGGVAAVVGSIAGIVALSGASDLNAACPGQRCPAAVYDDPAFQSDLDRNRTWGTVATVSFVVGGIALVAAGALWLLTPREHKGVALEQRYRDAL